MTIVDFTNFASHINSKFLPLLANRDRYLILFGGAGSGKSVFTIQKMLLRILLSGAKGYKEKFLFLRKTHTDCRKTVFSLTKYLIDDLMISDLCNIQEGSMNIRFVNGSEILHLGIDDPDKIKSIPNITSIFCEESTDFNEEDLQQLDLRLRGNSSSYKQIIMCFNPVSEHSWINKKFFQEKVDNCTICHSTYRDNKFLDKEYINVLDNIRDKTTKDVYKEGLWGRLEHSIFKNYVICDKFPDQRYFTKIRYGLDFGYHNALLLKVAFYNDDVYILDELHSKEKSVSELASTVKEKIGDQKDRLIVADCANPEAIADFQKCGMNIKGCRKTKNSISTELDWLKNRKIFISPKCQETVREIESYTYKKDKNGNIFDVPDDKCIDHALDALRYSIQDWAVSMKLTYSLGSTRVNAQASGIFSH